MGPTTMKSATTMRFSAAVTRKSTAAAKPAATSISTMPGISAAIGIPTAIRSSAACIAAPVKSTIGISATYKTTPPICRGKTAAVATTKPAIVETTAVKITGIPSFKKRAIVVVIVIIPVVTVPGRIIIVSIPGEFIFVYRTTGKTYTGIHIYLCVALGGNQAGPDNGHECK
jgi:hypothetical protein